MSSGFFVQAIESAAEFVVEASFTGSGRTLEKTPHHVFPYNNHGSCSDWNSNAILMTRTSATFTCIMQAVGGEGENEHGLAGFPRVSRS